MNAIQKRARVQDFLARHDLDLQQGCLLLGGPPALSRIQRFRRAVATAERLSSGHRRELSWLKGLLDLDQVHDLDGDEAEYFADADPSDPLIFVICGLTEALDTLISDLGQPGYVQNVQKRDAA